MKNKQKFIHELAEFLAGRQVELGIGLSYGKPESEQWAKLRNLTPLFGYPTVEEAEAELTEFLA